MNIQVEKIGCNAMNDTTLIGAFCTQFYYYKIPTIRIFQNSSRERPLHLF